VDLKYKIKFDELEWIVPGDDIRYKCYQHDEQQLRLIEFGKNMVHPDWCLKGHFGYIIEGRLELSFSDHSDIYQPGDALFIPDGEKHKHRPKALTDKVVFFSVEKT
jgi:quercetin dioxygenase-like cupin family protein